MSTGSRGQDRGQKEKKRMPPADTMTLQSALEAKRAELAAMSPTDIEPAPGLDASLAAGIVLGSLPRIAKHRDAIVAQFGPQGGARVDGLALMAYATEQACVELAAADSVADLSAMHADLLEEHALLVTDADALANRKLLERARVDAGRPILGYRATVTSTLVLVSVFREHWSAVSGKTPLTLADLERVEKKAQRMLQTLHEREQGSTRLAAADQRTRALSMLLRQYGEVRRMLTFVRWWTDDADAIAPSLWSGRRGKGRGQSASPPAPDPGPDLTTGKPVSPLLEDGGPFTS